MNKNKFLLNLTAFLFAVFSTMPSFSVQDVYEYKDTEGVTEFTDQQETGKKLEKHIQIEKRTPEQEVQSKEQLDDIMKKDKQLDKKLARERKLENEQLRRQQEQAKQEQKRQYAEDADHNIRFYNDGWYYRRGLKPPIRDPKPGNLPVNRPRPMPHIR